MVIQFSDAWKRLSVALVGAAMAGVLGLSGCGATGGPSQAAPSSEDRNARGATGRQGRETKEPGNVDLSSMLTDIPEYQGQGRNLFAYGQRQTPAPPPVPQPTPVPQPPATTSIGPSTAPPPRVHLEFAGYVEKPERGGEKKKYAVLLDGPEILTGAVGDLVANRYEIVEIGLESVTIRVEGSQITQRIPLRTN